MNTGYGIGAVLGLSSGVFATSAAERGAIAATSRYAWTTFWQSGEARLSESVLALKVCWPRRRSWATKLQWALSSTRIPLRGACLIEVVLHRLHLSHRIRTMQRRLNLLHRRCV